MSGPEDPVISKVLDNKSVEIVADDLCLKVRQPVEPESGIQKEIEITLTRERISSYAPASHHEPKWMELCGTRHGHYR